jgi:putative tryptophan/tyrosine transport system substrate-binding protein
VRVALNPLLGGSGWSQGGPRRVSVVLEAHDQGPLSVSRLEEFEGAFESTKRARAEALIVCASPFFNAHRKRVVDLAEQHRLQRSTSIETSPAIGGLMSYGPNLAEMYRSAARCIDKILKGAKPADLPVEQPTKFELVVNLKTAKALGVTIPPSFLGRTDEVIQ